MKAYQELCTDLIEMLEELEESLEEIGKIAELSENQPETSDIDMERLD